MSEVWRHIKHYSNVDKLKNDVQNLLKVVPSLRTAVRFAGSGRGGEASSINLLYLYGTVAIYYSGNQYNIPVAIYFDPPYPYSPPRCFVTPTSNMKIKNNHKHVDSRGVVYLPYLSAWNSTNSTLGELVAIMSSTFSEDPPVFSVASPPTAQPQPSSCSSCPTSSFASSSSFPSYQSSSSPSYTSYSYSSLPSRPPSSALQPSYPSTSSSSSSSQLSHVEILKKNIAADITQKWYSVVCPIIQRVDQQIALQSRLRYYQSSLSESLKDLDRSTESLESDTRSIQAIKDAASEFIQKETEKPLPADSIVQPSDGLSKQILELTASAQAYEDLMGRYEEFFNSGVLELTDFLRQVRKACAEQYLVRQLLKKVLERKRQSATR